MSQDEFTKLFSYMQKHFEKIEAELKTKADAERMYITLDAILKNQETGEQERLAANSQLNRHERWIKKAANKLKISYGSD